MAKRTYSRCGNPRDRPKSAYCKKCHAAYMRQWRKTWTERMMKKIAAALRKMEQDAA